MLLIGITGGIGSGKSAISDELRRRGYMVYDTDREAKRIIETRPAVRKAITDLLGEEAYREVQGDDVQGTKVVYDTSYVASRVFADASLLERLNAIVHPAVASDIKEIGRSRIPHDILFIESAILFSSGLAEVCHRVVVIDAPEQVRLQRVIARDYRGELTDSNINKVHARMRAQEKELALCKESQLPVLVVNNDGRKPVRELVDRILSDSDNLV